MDNEIYDDYEWEIDSYPSCTSSGDEENEWIHEFGAKTIDENGNELTGTAFYSSDELGMSVTFMYVDYELREEIDDDDDDDEF